MTPSIPAPANAPATIDDRLTPAGRALAHDIGALAARANVTAYAVGGCVRDWLLGVPVDDIDIMVEGDAITLAKRFAAAHKGTVAEHPQFRTATVEYRVAKRVQCVDFATCRKERYSAPAAYPKVSPGPLRDDLFRRDFTINAMAMHVAPATFGRLVDLFRGAEDLQARLIRVLHRQSFRDDPSRILRAVRFAERLHCTIEPETAAWMREALQEEMLAKLNRGRLRKELLAMLDEPEPLRCLQSLGQWLLGARVR